MFALLILGFLGVAKATCPVVFRGSACSLGNGPGAQYKFCVSPNGLYFDSLALTFEPDDVSGSFSQTICGTDCNLKNTNATRPLLPHLEWIALGLV